MENQKDNYDRIMRTSRGDLSEESLMENQKDNYDSPKASMTNTNTPEKSKSSDSAGCWVLVFFGLVMLGTWLAPGISEYYRRVSQLPVVGEWKGEDDQTVIMAFGKDGWFEMRNHKGEETDPDTLRRIQANEEFDKAHGITTGPPPTKTPETEEDKAIREETERIIRERGNQYRKSEGVPNMRYKIDDDEDPVWLDIIAFDKAGKPMLTIKCIMKHPKNNKDKMIIKFPVDYTQLLGHIPLDISRYDRPTSFSGQEENRIKLLRKATLAVKGLLRLEDTGLDEHGYIISSPDIRVGETPTPESKPASTPESEEDKAIREVKEQVLKEGTK